MAYITLNELKARLGISDGSQDAKLTSMLNGAVEFVEEYCNRNFSGVDMSCTEKIDFNPINTKKDHYVFFLKNIDISSITSLKVGGVDVQVDDYKWDANGKVSLSGYTLINLTQQYYDLQDISITYTYGYKARTGSLSTPSAVNEAIVALVNNNLTGGFSGASSEKVGDYQINYGASSGVSGSGGITAGGVFTNDVLTLIDRYKWWRV